MTALLALRKLRPHDIVTVDKSVPRVPLVREGLRAGEQVEAWKLFYSLLLYSAATTTRSRWRSPRRATSGRSSAR